MVNVDSSSLQVDSQPKWHSQPSDHLFKVHQVKQAMVTAP